MNILILVCITVCQTVFSQPPGVPPHHTPGVPPHQQPGVVPPQQGQPNTQNFQQGQQHQQNYQTAQEHAHVHEGTGKDTLRFKNDVHNTEHIMEHLQEVIEAKSKDQMTEEELEFHYFKMHDYNGDNKLDGVEIGKALTHFHGDERKDDNGEHVKVFSDDEIGNIVDEVLKENDSNGDGYIEYFEFKKNQDTHRNTQTKGN